MEYMKDENDLLFVQPCSKEFSGKQHYLVR